MSIYTDHKAIILCFNQLCNNAAHFLRNCPNFDLWTQVSRIIRERPVNAIQVQWTPSHVDVHTCKTEDAVWRALGNQQADLYAKQANETRTQEFKQIVKTAATSQNEYVEIVHKAHLFQFDVLQFQVEYQPEDEQDIQKDSTKSEKVQPIQAPSVSDKSKFVFGLDLPDKSAFSPFYYFGQTYLNRLLTYLKALRWSDPEVPQTHFVTVFELLLDFIASTGTYPPARVGSKFKKVDIRYVLMDTEAERARLASTSYRDMLERFTDSIQYLCRISVRDLLPGFTKSCKRLQCTLFDNEHFKRGFKRLTMRPKLVNEKVVKEHLEAIEKLLVEDSSLDKPILPNFAFNKLNISLEHDPEPFKPSQYQSKMSAHVKKIREEDPDFDKDFKPTVFRPLD